MSEAKRASSGSEAAPPSLAVTPVEAELVDPLSLPTLPPETFAAYARVSPGFGERVLAMIEAQGAHRRASEQLELEAALRIAEQPHFAHKRGQLLTGGALLAVLTFAFCILKFIPGDAAAGVAKTAVQLMIGALAIAFVGGKAAEAYNAKREQGAKKE